MVILSGLSKQDRLIPEMEWLSRIDSIKSTELKESVILNKLPILIKNAVEARIPKRRFGVLLSGGVDSSLIAYLCSRKTKNFVCFTAGVGDSLDMAYSIRFCKKYGLDHIAKVFTIEECERIIEETILVLGEHADTLAVGVGSVELASIKLAEKNNIRQFFGGLGSEEIFAGYERHSRAADTNKECINGLRSMWNRDLVRDFKIANHCNIVFLTPFLDTELVDFAVNIPGELKIKGDVKKYALREAAVKLGLDMDFAYRPKKAAQYGSNFHKALMKVSKKNGFRYIKDYLVHKKKHNNDDQQAK
jgi:asparagine synthase (glutamine-hydrolysing)